MHLTGTLHRSGETTMDTSTQPRARAGDWLLAIAVALAGCLLVLSWTMASG